MIKKFEAALYVAALAILGVLLITEGRHTTELLAKQPVTPKQLMAQLGNPQLKLQVVDARAYDDDHFLDAHVPGSIPMPGCDPAQAPEAARDRAYPYVATVIVTDDGNAAAFEACKARFGNVRLLAGGFTAWSDASLPEDTGDYSPPKNAAGGGCL
ncbi:MAG: rhodanese-like domain-containing protein [Myxococcaceae bacterium]